MQKHLSWLFIVSLLFTLSSVNGQNPDCSVSGLTSEVYYHPSYSVLAADLSWDATDGADQYQVSYYSAHSGEVIEDPTSNTYLTIIGLSEDANYDWRVRARCNGSWSGWGEWNGFFTTDVFPPYVLARDVTLSLNEDGMVVLRAQDIDDGSWDSSGDLFLYPSQEEFFCEDIGEHEVTLYGIDPAGNEASATSIVTIIDDLAPSLAATEFTLQLDLDGFAHTDEISYDEIIRENCGIESIVVENLILDCENLDGVTLELFITDVNGNSATQNLQIHLIDPYAPVVDLQNLSLNLNDDGAATIELEAFQGTISDNCSLTGVELSRTAFSCEDLGENEVTITATDLDGNTTEQIVLVTIGDVNPPAIEVQPLSLDLDNDGLASLEVGDLDAAVTDNCGIIEVSLGQTEFSCDDIGENDVTIYATDINGNESQLTFSVIINDVTPPAIEVQPLSLDLDNDGLASLEVGDLDATVTDNCGIIEVSLDQTEFSCDDIGENDVTIYATDTNGNESELVFSVTINDLAPPVIEVEPISFELDYYGSIYLEVGDLGASITDNCAIIEVSLGQSLFNCDDIGENDVTIYATDINGNESSETFTVTILDNSPPSLRVKDAQVSLDENGEVWVTTNDVVDRHGDECSSEVSLRGGYFNCDNLGTNPILVSAADGAGNLTFEFAFVEVVDDLPPTLLLKDYILALDANGIGTLSFEDIDDGSNDNCGITSVELGQSDFTCNDLGEVEVLVTVADVSGNTTQGTANILVVDYAAPQAVLANVEIALNDNGMVTISAEDIDAGSTDNCDIVSFELDKTDFTCDDLGENVVTATLTDAAGNETIGSAIVTIVDNTPPNFEVQDIEIFLDERGQALATRDFVVENTDACDEPALFILNEIFNCEDAGDNLTIVASSDMSGNVVIDQITVTVTDNLPPVPVLMDASLTLDASGTASLTTGAVDNGSYDNCGIQSIALGQADFTCDHLGENQIEVTVTDIHGNEATDYIIVTVTDEIAPSLGIEDITLSLDEYGLAFLSTENLINQTSDNCSIESLTVDQSEFDCTDLGIITVTATATDPSGNSGLTTFEVTVVDETAPLVLVNDITLSLDDTGNASLTFESLDAGTTDNCGIESVTINTTDFNCEHLGENVVEIFVLDASGNSATAQATVTIIDDIAPTATISPATIQLNDEGVAFFDPDDLVFQASDNCSIASIDIEQTVFTCYEIGGQTIGVTFTDESGNSAVEPLVLTVLDEIAPVAQLNDITIALDNSGTANFAFEDIDEGSFDNCWIASVQLSQTEFYCEELGENIVDYILSDESGNSVSGQVIITVEVGELELELSTELIPGDELESGATEYEINYSIEATCGIELESHAVITVPNVELIEPLNLEPVITPVGFNLEIEGYFINVIGTDPTSLFNLIVAHQGIPVHNTQTVIIQNIDEPIYTFVFEGDQLVEASGPVMELLLRVYDLDGLLHTSSDDVSGDTGFKQLATVNTGITPSVFPVPTTDYFNINFTEELPGGDIRIRLLNVVGTVVQEKTIDSSQLHLGINYHIGGPSLQSGQYILQVHGPGISYSTRVMKI